MIHTPIEKVWQYWTMPEHITKWCAASDDWHAPNATNDLREGGIFITRMEAKDGSVGFDFGGTYTKIVPNEYIEYKMNGAERNVAITFSKDNENCKVTETFDPENENPIEMQRAGWQAILDNFKNYVEQK